MPASANGCAVILVHDAGAIEPSTELNGCVVVFNVRFPLTSDHEPIQSAPIHAPTPPSELERAGKLYDAKTPPPTWSLADDAMVK